jgi:cytochrome c oxidase subunit II
MADLWWLLLWLGVAVFAAFLAFLVVGLVRRSAAEAPVPRQARSARWILVWGVALPTLLLVVIFGATVYAMRVIPSEAPADALVIEVVGHQWFYEVHYPEAEVTLRNELHLPVGRPIALQLTSADVIHSFWVPELAGKLDMLPDGVNTLVLQADQPGEHWSRCAEFCGLEHADMRLAVVAEPAEAFEAWLASQEGRR